MMELLPKQEHAVFYLNDKTTTEIIYGGAAGGGKSALGCLWLIEMCQTYEGSRWVMGRSKLKSLKETTLNSFFDISSKLDISSEWIYQEQKGVIKWNNGSEILLKDLFQYPSDREFDSLGSLEICGAFVDECNQITLKAWQTIKSRMRYKLNEFGLTPKLLGSCNPSKNWVFSNFFTLASKGLLPKYRKFIQALPTDNPHLPPSYIQSLREMNTASRERLLEGNWNYDDDPSLLCSYDAISDIFTNTHVKREGLKSISTDLAMMGRDKYIAGFWEGLTVEVAIDMDKSTSKQIEDSLTDLKNRKGVGNSKIVADSDGLGAYLSGYMSNIVTFHGGSRPLNGKESKVIYNNLKSQCAFKLAEVINKRLLRVICTPEQEELIREELSSCLKEDNVDALVSKIISKDKMREVLGHSPDYMDMLLMGMYFVVQGGGDLIHEASVW